MDQNEATIAALQKQLIEAQQKLIDRDQELLAKDKELLSAHKQIIALQKKLAKQMPKNPKDKDLFWHLASDGIMSTEAATSDDLITVRQFYDHLLRLAKTHLRPYVNPKVYGEVLNQMTRGLASRIAELETREEMRQQAESGRSVTITPIK